MTAGAAAALALYNSDLPADPNEPDDFKNDIPNESSGRDINKRESKRCLAIYEKLKSEGYNPDLGQIAAEHFVRNDISAAKATADEIRECLYAYYLHLKKGGADEYHYFATNYHPKQLWLEKEIRHADIPDGRRLTGNEVHEVYKECYNKRDENTFRKAIVQYRIKNKIPGLKTTMDEYIRCVDEYEKQTKIKDFIAFEYEFMKKAREFRDTDQKAAIPPAETQKDKMATN